MNERAFAKRGDFLVRGCDGLWLGGFGFVLWKRKDCLRVKRLLQEY